MCHPERNIVTGEADGNVESKSLPRACRGDPQQRQSLPDRVREFSPRVAELPDTV